MKPCLHSPSTRNLPIYLHLNRNYSQKFSKTKTPSFPHGFPATEHLVPPSQDGSTPLTDKLPRSIILDPTTYFHGKKIRREKEPSGRAALAKLTPLERRVRFNPFGSLIPTRGTFTNSIAQMLASPPRNDCLAKRISLLPRGNLPSPIYPSKLRIDFLVSFGIFQSSDEKDRKYWVLPVDLSPTGHFSSGKHTLGQYRIARKIAIDELGSQARFTKWHQIISFLPKSFRKKAIYRDGMSLYILEILRQHAWKSLWNVPKKFLFYAQVDDDLTRVAVGNHNRQKVVSIVESNDGNGKSASSDGRGGERKRDDIIGVLYVGPEELRNASWEFKEINVDGQTLKGVLFNLRRLFPQFAEEYISRHHPSGNAVAIALGEEPRNAVHQLLKLAFYLDGDPKVNYTMEERLQHRQDVERRKSNIEKPGEQGIHD